MDKGRRYVSCWDLETRERYKKAEEELGEQRCTCGQGHDTLRTDWRVYLGAEWQTYLERMIRARWYRTSEAQQGILCLIL